MTTLHTLARAALAAALCVASAAWAQSGPPVDAGSLLEQQRRQPPAPPPQAPEPGVLPGTPARPAPDTATATDTDAAAQTLVRRFEVTGNVLLDDAAVQQALAPWTDQRVGLRELRQAVAALEDAYRARGWLARVSLPAQDITNGTVRLAVTEARLGRVLVQQGTPAVAPALAARVQAMLEHQLPPGEPLSLMALERALLLADELPGVRLQGSLQASDTAGASDVLVALSTEATLRGEASVDNGGNRATGHERVNAQLQLQSPLGLGEQFGLGASASRGTRYLSLGASAPLPGAPGLAGWRMNANASVLRYDVLDARNTTTGLPPEGDSNSLGLGLQVPLVRTALANWQASVGLAQNRLHNRDDNRVLDRLDTTSRARSRALQLSLAGSQFDRWAGGGSTSASLALTHGRLSLDGSPLSQIEADTRSVATQGSFSKLRFGASRQQTLTPRTTLMASLGGQLASANLDPSEKLYLGGPYGVRAYPNGEGGGSNGLQFTAELRQQLAAQWQASAFYDWGQVQQYKRNRFADGSGPLVADNRVRLQGAGLALAWRPLDKLQIKATWAHRLVRNPLATASGADTDGSRNKNRFWLEASIAF